MKDLITSDVTGKTYDPAKCVRILNSLQAAKYIKNKCYPLDVYASIDFKTGQDVCVYIFDRQESAPLYDAWCNHTL